ncbi:MAG: MraY family glycosyltransferase [Acidiferrobacterales bacterium]
MRYLWACVIGVGVTSVLLWVLRPLATRIGLVDRPGKRKLHKGNVALIGGIAMFTALAFSVLTFDISLPAFRSFVAAATLLVVVGFVDDLWELPSRIRFAVQITAALIMTLGGGVVVQDLGAITGNEIVTLGAWAIPFTVFATVGVINALNMSDGIDGLAGGLSFIAFALLSYVAMASGRVADASILVLLTCIVGTFLLFNLRSPWRSRALVFMGDAGSMFLGFALAWFVISLSQGENRAMTPVTALWILALPLIDTVSILLRRVLSGRSPFSGDRDHLHHILLMAGCSVNKTNGVLLSATLILGLAAVFALYHRIAEHIMFYCFLGLGLAHLWGMMHLRNNWIKNREQTEPGISIQGSIVRGSESGD